MGREYVKIKNINILYSMSSMMCIILDVVRGKKGMKADEFIFT